MTQLLVPVVRGNSIRITLSSCALNLLPYFPNSFIKIVASISVSAADYIRLQKHLAF